MIEWLVPIYWLTSAVLLTVIATNRNAVSVSAIFGLGLIAYSTPLYTGYIEFRTSYLHNQIYTGVPMPNVFGIFILAQVCCLIALFFEGRLFRKKITTRTVNIKDALMAIHVISLIYILNINELIKISIHPFSIQITAKGDADFDLVYYIASISSIFILIDCAWRRSIEKIVVIPVAFLLLDLSMGFRNNFFLGVISISLCYFHGVLNSISLKSRFRIFFAGLFIIVSAFVYKPIYYGLQIGGFARMIENFQDIDVMFIFTESESTAQIGIINEIIKSNVSIPVTDLLGQVFQFLPFSESVFGFSKYSTNTFIQNNLFPETEWGLASSSFGSLWLLGQWFAIIVFLFFNMLFCIWKPRAHLSSIVYFFMAPYVVFYMHRNDWYASIGTLKLALIVLLLAFLVRPVIAAVKGIAIHAGRYTIP